MLPDLDERTGFVALLTTFWVAFFASLYPSRDKHTFLRCGLLLACLIMSFVTVYKMEDTEDRSTVASTITQCVCLAAAAVLWPRTRFNVLPGFLNKDRHRVLGYAWCGASTVLIGFFLPSSKVYVVGNSGLGAFTLAFSFFAVPSHLWEDRDFVRFTISGHLLVTATGLGVGFSANPTAGPLYAAAIWFVLGLGAVLARTLGLADSFIDAQLRNCGCACWILATSVFLAVGLVQQTDVDSSKNPAYEIPNEGLMVSLTIASGVGLLGAGFIAAIPWGRRERRARQIACGIGCITMAVVVGLSIGLSQSPWTLTAAPTADCTTFSPIPQPPSRSPTAAPTASPTTAAHGNPVERPLSPYPGLMTSVIAVLAIGALLTHLAAWWHRQRTSASTGASKLSVFISHATSDSDAVFRLVYSTLYGFGYKVFYPPRDLTEGSTEQMESFVKESNVVVAVLSPLLFHSKYCCLELAAAMEAGITVIPVYNGDMYQHTATNSEVLPWKFEETEYSSQALRDYVYRGNFVRVVDTQYQAQALDALVNAINARCP